MPEPITTLEPFNNNIEAYYVDSESHYKIKYAVALSDDNKWSCSCPDWMYRRPVRGCKHISRVKSLRAFNQVIAEPKLITRFAAMDV